MLLPARSAFAALLAVLVLALLGFVQVEVAVAVSGDPGISATRQGDAAALPRATGKTQAAEVWAGRPLPVKFVGSNSGILIPAPDFPPAGQGLPAKAVAAPAFMTALPARTNQPRAPPFA